MKIVRILLGAAVVGQVFAITAMSAFAVNSDTGSVQGYAADTPLESGVIVQMSDKKSSRVKLATQADEQQMFGVTVDRIQVPVTVSNESLENETFVAVSGTYNVRVSTQGGAIVAGDYVTVSSINGVAMKASPEEKTVFGRANSAFDGTIDTLGSAELKDTSGQVTQKVAIGSIPVTIDIRKNPNEKSTKARVPEVLERIGQAVAEKEVSPIRIYLSMAITAVSLIAAIAVLYSGVRSGVISIGRNPMSKKSIFRALLEIILTSILILIIGLFAVYLLLKL